MATRKASRLTEVAVVDESPDSVARRTFVTLTVATGFITLVGFLYLIRTVLVWLVIAVVIALALAPLVSWLVRRGLNRVLASLVAIVATLAVVLGLLSAIATPLVNQGSNLINNFPEFVENVTKNPTLRSLDSRFHLVEKARDAANSTPELLTGAKSPVLNTAKNTVSAVATLIAILTLSFFMLLEGPASWKQFVTLLKPRHARRVDRTAGKIARAISGYVTGNLFISLIAGLVALATLLVLGVPYAVPLAVLVAIFDLIPLIGAFIAALILALVALSQSAVTAVAVLVIIMIYQTIEGNVIQPIVYSRTVQLSPLLILVASIVGATLGGIVGVLLAIPVASAAQIVVIELLSGTASGRRAHLR